MVEFFADVPQAGTLDPLDLAWYLRQLDTRRSLALLEEVAQGRKPLDPSSKGRAQLIRSEAAIHHGRLEESRRLLDESEQHFADDPIGRCDARFLGALLVMAQGQSRAALALVDEALALAKAADVVDRAAIATAYGAMLAVYGDPHSAMPRLEQADKFSSPVAAVYRGLAHALHDFNRGDHSAVVRSLEPLSAEARRLGMLQIWLRVQNTIAAAYSNLDDKDSAIASVQGSLDQAREAGWPVAMGEALSFLGNFYRETGHHARAVDTLTKARESLAVVPQSRGYALACCYLAHAQLAAGAAEKALEHALEAERVASVINALPIVVDVLTVAARAKARLGQAPEAAELAERALAVATENKLGVWEIDALRALAEIHSLPEVPAPAAIPKNRAALLYLERAQSCVDAAGGHSERASILRELARAHEAAGDLRAAIEAERAAFDQALSDDAQRINNRMLAVEAHHQVERQRLEVEHQREVAASEAARATALAQSLEALERISLVGRELTAKLDVDALVATLARRVGLFATAHFVGIAAKGGERRELTLQSFEAGKPQPPRLLSLSDENSPLIRAFLTGQELVVGAGEKDLPLLPLEGTRQMLSSWCAPLEVAGERLGALIMQSLRRDAFGERERLIFRTLAAYVGVALANARAYRALDMANNELKAAHAELEQLASTDSLTGIANRRSFLAKAQAEVERSLRYGHRTGFVMCDIDKFKSINDALGHPCGDRVIVAASQALSATMRSTDSIGRLGGEEFALLLPQTNLADALAVAERLRLAVEAALVEWEGRQVPFTMSFGAAVLATRAGEPGPIDPVEALEELVRRADAALYEAKAGGRNQVRGG